MATGNCFNGSIYSQTPAALASSYMDRGCSSCGHGINKNNVYTPYLQLDALKSAKFVYPLSNTWTRLPQDLSQVGKLAKSPNFPDEFKRMYLLLTPGITYNYDTSY